MTTKAENRTFTAFCKDAAGNMVQLVGCYEEKTDFMTALELQHSELRVFAIVSEDDVAFIRRTLGCSDRPA
jgi:hypothetical protein